MSPPHTYTILLFTPSTGVPTFLHYLQQSPLSILWLGENLTLRNLPTGSTWPWSHILVVEGKWDAWPRGCQVAQEYKFNVESSEPFKAVEDGGSEDKEEAEQKICTCPSRHDEPLWKKKVAVLNFCNDITTHVDTKGGHVHLSATITSWHRDLGFHGTNHASKPEAPEDDSFSPKHVEMLGFAPQTPFENCQGNAWVTQVVLPPKDEKISMNDWRWGNPHEPIGCDFFG
jgi:hypothetical protein